MHTHCKLYNTRKLILSCKTNAGHYDNTTDSGWIIYVPVLRGDATATECTYLFSKSISICLRYLHVWDIMSSWKLRQLFLLFCFATREVFHKILLYGVRAVHGLGIEVFTMISRISRADRWESCALRRMHEIRYASSGRRRHQFEGCRCFVRYLWVHSLKKTECPNHMSQSAGYGLRGTKFRTEFWHFGFSSFQSVCRPAVLTGSLAA